MTKATLATVVAGLIAYDVWAYLEPQEGDTISEVALAAARRWPVLPWAFGAFAAHLFWPSAAPRSTGAKFAGLGGLLAIAGAASWADLGGVHPGLAIVVGLASGRLLWPQTKAQEPKS